MHPYATNSEEKKIIIFFLAIGSILLAWPLNKLLEVFEFKVHWFIDVSSAFTIYGLFYFLFEKYIWRWKLLRKIRLVKIPDLNGEWLGFVASSYDDHKTRHDANVKISQTWGNILIEFFSDKSKSHSVSATIFILKDGKSSVISYEYYNEPKYDSTYSMQVHSGSARFSIDENRMALKGDYYTNKRERGNFGIIELKKIESM